MKYAILLLLGLSSLYGGAICEYKIRQAKEGLEAYEKKPSPSQSKLAKARDELESLQKHCDDEKILQEVQENIACTRERLDEANAALAQARAANDQAALQQATLEQKIAQVEYIAARQEELRLKDLLKPAP